MRIEVGTGEHKKNFTIHKQLLSEKAPVFDKMFNGGFQEAETKTASLPEDETYAFEGFVEWLYRGTIPTVAIHEMIELLGVSHFASKYLLNELQDRALTKFIQMTTLHKLLPQLQHIAKYCALTTETSKLRLYLVRTAAWIILNFGESETSGSWSTVQFGEIFKEDPILMVDVLKAIRGTGQLNQKFTDPKAAPKCDYHQHEKVDACPYD